MLATYSQMARGGGGRNIKISGNTKIDEYK